MFKRLAQENNKFDEDNQSYECPLTTFSFVDYYVLPDRPGLVSKIESKKDEDL